MRFQCFAVPVLDPDTACQVLNGFLATQRILTVEKSFVANGDKSFWSFCVTYTLSPQAIAAKKGKIDYREILPEPQFAIFAELRSLRNSLAKNEGIPAYAVFNNEQLVAMTTLKQASKTQLLEIPGVGKARVEKYATPFLRLLQKLLAPVNPEQKP